MFMKHVVVYVVKALESDQALKIFGDYCSQYSKSISCKTTKWRSYVKTTIEKLPPVKLSSFWGNDQSFHKKLDC